MHAQALDDDECYAMLDSGTEHANSVPLHASMEGEVPECQVPGATVTGLHCSRFDDAVKSIQRRLADKHRQSSARLVSTRRS